MEIKIEYSIRKVGTEVVGQDIKIQVDAKELKDKFSDHHEFYKTFEILGMTENNISKCTRLHQNDNAFNTRCDGFKEFIEIRYLNTKIKNIQDVEQIAERIYNEFRRVYDAVRVIEGTIELNKPLK